MSNFERLIKESKAEAIQRERLYQEWRSIEITKRTSQLKRSLIVKIEELIKKGLQNDDDDSISGELSINVSHYNEHKRLFPWEIVSTPEYTEFISTLDESYKPCVITVDFRIDTHLKDRNHHYLYIHIKIKDSWLLSTTKKFIDFVSVKKDEYVKLVSF